jgi:two-component system sensor histidine kinase VicK
MPSQTKNVAFSDILHIGKLSDDGVFIYSLKENRFTYLNASLVRILEINKKLLMEEPAIVLKTMLEEDQEYIKTRFTEFLEQEFLEDVQIRIFQNKVEKILSCSCYRSTDMENILGFVEDITKPKEHEDYLINYGARKDAVLDTVSQRLTTPLNLSRFTVDLIEKAITEKKFEKINSHVKIIREVTEECIDFIHNFMIQEHMESPAIHTKTNRFDVIAKIRVILEKLKQSYPDKQLRFQTKLKHLFIDGDDLKFFQIIHNLLSNSIKFTKDHGVIETTVKNYKTKIEVTIKDDGIGIPERLQPYIFEQKTRASRPGLKGERSNGIGLYVVHKLTGLMGGKISFESKEKKGTAFILEIPKTN